MLNGVVTALLTPEISEGIGDVESCLRVAQYTIDGGVDGLFILGTNGEGLRFPLEERRRIAHELLTRLDRRGAKMCVHTGCSSVADTVSLSRSAMADGADCVAIVTPSLLSYHDEAIYEYYKAIADAAPEVPFYLYNIPQRAANDISAEVAARLTADCPNIIGMKYSFCDMSRTMAYLRVEGMPVLHGADVYQLQFRTMGCAGVISGLAGVYPVPFCRVRDYYNAGDMENARRWQSVCYDVCELLSGGCVPVMKEVMRLKGFAFGGSRYFRDPEDLEALRLRMEATDRLVQEHLQLDR